MDRSLRSDFGQNCREKVRFDKRRYSRVQKDCLYDDGQKLDYQSEDQGSKFAWIYS